MKKITKIIGTAVLGATALIVLAGCVSDADNASRNLSTAAEQFEVNRRITVTSGVTDTVVLEVEGRCSVETGSGENEATLAGALEITCKIGDNEYVKHFAIVGDNGMVAIQQLDTVDVSVYHHRVIIKPENILPEFDYEGGEQ
jgi:hypothetical protein